MQNFKTRVAIKFMKRVAIFVSIAAFVLYLASGGMQTILNYFGVMGVSGFEIVHTLILVSITGYLLYACTVMLWDGSVRSVKREDEDKLPF